ncbi:DUF5694 domain-containing protein [Cellulophaga baltica]|uniref:Uncharacterized protein n=1 Tax=Cellulophaga baltica TaxID=76594 RepID=A0A1G7M0Z4_9FLAO|nr:DUF5694 domain-containing protein [Cellulophaga baltica]SDF54849.1 hypothetical protein SAMN04487992_12414 [Cellulophaga baltica]
MKNLIYILTVLVLLTSCNQQKDKIFIDKLKLDNLSPIEDPNLFIGKHKTKAMVLGVFHFNDAGLDGYKPKFPFNILEDKKQVELETLLNKIAEYKPTKILLEWNRIKADSIVNERYQNYLKDSFDISEKSNEVYQIGFKLAKKLGHDRIFCSDASADWFGVNLDWDNYDEDAYLKSQGQYKKARRYDFDAFYKIGDSLKTTRTLTELLLRLNNPENRRKDHQSYLTKIIEGAGDNYLGADNVARWYRRNLRIFANTLDITDFDKEERLLLIYGSGHVWQLRQFFTDSPDFDYVEPNDYLISKK